MQKPLSTDRPAALPVFAAEAPEAAADPTLSEMIQGVSAVLAAKPWHRSLTVRGATLTFVSGLVTAYGPTVLTALGYDAGDAGLLAHSIAGIMASVGSVLAVVGRLRLGGLH